MMIGYLIGIVVSFVALTVAWHVIEDHDDPDDALPVIIFLSLCWPISILIGAVAGTAVGLLWLINKVYNRLGSLTKRYLT